MQNCAPEVLILAAGRGARMRPLTDITPKALLPLTARTTLIERHLLQLRARGFADAVINLGWLGEKIRDALGDGGRYGMRIRYSPEIPGALNTGGGIAHALRLIRGAEFLLVNADIVTDFDFAALQLPGARDMQLALVPNPPHAPGDFALRGGRLCMPAANAPSWTYAGIARFRRGAFAGFGRARFALREVFARGIASGRAGAQVYRGRWVDAGTPQRLQYAREMAAAGKLGGGGGD